MEKRHWFRCLFDLFGDHTLSGWGEAGWAILLIFVPWLGALIYLIARGRSMGERQMAASADAQAQQEKYIKSVAAASASPAEQIASGKSLLDLRRHHPAGVRHHEGEGPRLTCPPSSAARRQLEALRVAGGGVSP